MVYFLPCVCRPILLSPLLPTTSVRVRAFLSFSLLLFAYHILKSYPRNCVAALPRKAVPVLRGAWSALPWFPRLFLQLPLFVYYIPSLYYPSTLFILSWYVRKETPGFSSGHVEHYNLVTNSWWFTTSIFDHSWFFFLHFPFDLVLISFLGVIWRLIVCICSCP